MGQKRDVVVEETRVTCVFSCIHAILIAYPV